MEGGGVTGTLCGVKDSAAAGREVQLRAGGFRWQLAADYADDIVGPTGLRLPEWQASGAARLIKHGPHRSVYRVMLPGLDFYLKHFRLMDARTWLRQVIRPSKARMEYGRAVAVAERQVPTIQALGLGEADHVAFPGESYLLTRSLDGALPLSQFIIETLPRLRPSTRARYRIELARQLGRFMARVHRAGIWHRDLHAGNVLVQLSDDGLQLYLIDLHAIALRTHLPWPARRDNLVIFNRWFSLFTDRSDRRRFWDAYSRAEPACREGLATPLSPRERGGGEGEASVSTSRDARMAIVAMETRTWSSNLRFWRHRDRRSLANNRYYRRVSGPGVRGHVVADLPDDICRALLMDPEEPFRRPDATWLKNSRSSSVIEMEIPLAASPCLAIYKRFRVRSPLAPWLSLVRRTQALRSWVLGHGLAERCLPTARPLLLIERRRLGVAREAYLLTQKITNACDLHQFVAQAIELPAGERAHVLRDLIESLARLIRRLHDRGLLHRDLKATNILVKSGHSSAVSTPGVSRSTRPSAAGVSRSAPLSPRFGGTGQGEGENSRTENGTSLWTACDRSLCLIDLVGIQRVSRPGRNRRARDLARLQASLSIHPVFTHGDYLRFLRVYLQCGFTGTVGWKVWWRQIARLADAKVEKNRRAGRPLT
jgi:tRNA A-37 threonylcarbamoyl transferase component Bud32